jgi:hypothetical protein
MARKDASVPGKPGQKIPPKQAWEMKYDANACSKDMKLMGGSDFAPRPAKTRKTTYEKINEQDY